MFAPDTVETLLILHSKIAKKASLRLRLEFIVRLSGSQGEG